MRAQRSDLDRAGNDQLIETLDIVEFGNPWRPRKTPLQQFLNVHPRDPHRGVAGVVVIAVVDAQQLEHFLEFLRHRGDHALFFARIERDLDCFVAAAGDDQLVNVLAHRRAPTDRGKLNTVTLR